MDEDEILDLLLEQDGKLHCPVSTCDVWYPDGMQYGFLEHYGEHDVCLLCETKLEHAGNEFLCLDCAADF